MRNIENTPENCGDGGSNPPDAQPGSDYRADKRATSFKAARTPQFHRKALGEQLGRLAGLVGELKTVRVDSKRRELVAELDVAVFSALGHWREL